VHHGDAACRNEFDQSIAIADSVDTVLDDPVETEVASDGTAIDGEGGASQGGRSKRGEIRSPATVDKTLAVAVEHRDIGKKVVSKQNRLRSLHMRIAWHDGVGMALGLIDKSLLKRMDTRDKLVDRPTKPEPLIERDLIVATASGMEPTAGRPDLLDQESLDRHMNVFSGRIEENLAPLDLLQNLPQSTGDRAGILAGDDPLPGQHFHMGQAPLDVMGIEASIDQNRPGEAEGDIGQGFAEASTPEMWSGSPVAWRFSAHGIRSVLLSAEATW